MLCNRLLLIVFNSFFHDKYVYTGDYHAGVSVLGTLHVFCVLCSV